jgi:hypothetical protein
VAYPRIYYADSTFQLVVAPADGSSEGTVLGPRQPGEPEATFAFTPDGSAVISMYGSDDQRDIWRFPIDGSPGSVVAEGGMFSFADQQRLAP